MSDAFKLIDLNELPDTVPFTEHMLEILKDGIIVKELWLDFTIRSADELDTIAQENGGDRWRWTILFR